MIQKNEISRNILMSIFVLLSGAMIAVGRFYDQRLEIFGINITVVLSFLFVITFISVFFLIKSINISLNKLLLYLFFSLLFISNLTLWIFFDFTDYGIEKFINFILIPLPIALVISEKFNISDRNNMINVLLGISFFLFVVTLLNISTLSSSRSGVLGGGPIVLSRWLCFGAVITMFHPKINRFKIFFVLLFLVSALFTGSRGPVLSFLVVMFLYAFFNFRKIFLKSIVALSLLLFIGLITGAFEHLSQYKTVSRIFMNIQEGGLKKSTGRSLLFESSVKEILDYPFGVGSGNFVEYTGNSQYFKNKNLYYPHNLFLEIASEFGVITLFLFLLYLFHSIYLSFKINLTSKLITGNMLFYTFAFLFLNSMISGDLSDARLLFVFIPLMLVKDEK